MEKKMTTSPTNEYEKHPYEEGLNGVVGKNQQRKRISLLWAYGKNISKL